MNKRDFLRHSVYLAAGVPLTMMGCTNGTKPVANADKNLATLKSTSIPYQDTIGLQLWTVRDQMAENPKATLQAIKDLGYYQVELGDTRTAKELIPICDDLGLKVKSSFMLWTALTGRWDLVPHETKKIEFEEVLDQASAAGLSHLVFGYLMPGERETLDDYRKIIDVLNEAGMKAKERGIQMAYHNHNFEFEQMDGGVPFELMIDRFDKELMPFELDVFWAALAGYDPVELLGRIADRTKLLHLKDLKQGVPLMTTTDGVPEDAFQELGDGTLPIKKLAKMGKEMGVDYCFVEQDQSPDPLVSIQESMEFYQNV